QLDPVAGDELIGLLRRLNEEWGTTVVLAEHRLERCLTAADRVVALVDGRVACDAPPRDFLAWAADAAPALATPGARLLAAAGLGPPPVGVKEARATLRAAGALPAAGADPWADAPAGATATRDGRAAGAGARSEAGRAPRRWRRRVAGDAALRLEDLWVEHRRGAAVL